MKSYSKLHFPLKRLHLFSSSDCPFSSKGTWLPETNGFSQFSRKMLLSLEKLLDEKIFKISFPVKKVILIFVARRLFPSKRAWLPETVFHHFLGKCSIPSKKLLVEKMFKISFLIKKVILFSSPDVPFPLKGTWPPVMVFQPFLRKYCFFFLKKLLNNKIFSV